ncbi:MAG: hypothetical protein QXH27_02115 [Candidatus Micrarchaeia archaeon]
MRAITSLESKATLYATSAVVRTLLSRQSRQLLRKIRAFEAQRIYNGKTLFGEIVGGGKSALPPAEIYLFQGHSLGANIISEIAKKAAEKGEFDVRYKCARALGRAALLGDLAWNRAIIKEIRYARLEACELERSRVLSAVRRGARRLWMRVHDQAARKIITESNFLLGGTGQQLFDFVLMHGASAVPVAQRLLVSKQPSERLLGARLVRELRLYAYAGIALRLGSESEHIMKACSRAIKSAIAREEYSELKREIENALRTAQGEGEKYLGALKAKIAAEILADDSQPPEKRVKAARYLCHTTFESPALAAHIMTKLLKLYDRDDNLRPIISGVLLNNSSFTRLCTPDIAEVLGEAAKRHAELVFSIVEKFERYSDDTVCENVLDIVIEHARSSAWDVKRKGSECLLQLMRLPENIRESVKLALWMIYKSAAERKQQLEKGPSGAFVMLNPQNHTVVRSGGDKAELESIAGIIQLLDASPFGEEFRHNLKLNGFKSPS